MRKQYPAHCASIDASHRQQLQQQLHEDIIALRTQLSRLQASADAADHGRVNSCKMMLHARENMLSDLRRITLPRSS